MLIKETKEMTTQERIAAENSNNQYLQALSYVAVGTIYPFAGETAPDTFMICDGRELDVNEYSELFSVIRYAYGGDGDLFNLPDLRGKTIVGVDNENKRFNAVGKSGGEEDHTLTVKEMPSHRHGIEYSTDGQTWKSTIDNMFGRDGEYSTENYLGVSNSVSNFNEWSAQISENGDSQPHNNMPPYLTINYIIKVCANKVVKSDTFTLSDADKDDIANIVLANFTDVSEVGQ